MTYRQGDVLIISIDDETTTSALAGSATTEVTRDGGRIVLAYGEVTGHAHAIHDASATLLAVPDTDDRFLRIMDASGVSLQHEEHATITIPPGFYLVRRQREYQSKDMAPIRVAD